MSTLSITLIVAFVLIVVAIAAASFGWMYSGKSRMVRKRDSDPSKDPKKR